MAAGGNIYHYGNYCRVCELGNQEFYIVPKVCIKCPRCHYPVRMQPRDKTYLRKREAKAERRLVLLQQQQHGGGLLAPAVS